jgi:2-phospho-L-lactate guanylyltransferase
MTVLVPFAPDRPKTRLSAVLDGEERVAFARAMLVDVLDALTTAGHDPTVLSTAEFVLDRDVEMLIDDRELTPAINAQLDDLAPSDRDDQVAIVMADLALLTPAAVDQLVAADSDVVIAPGLGGGTNALVVRDPTFRVDYHGVSCRDHREAAGAVGATTTTVDSFRLAVDVDDPGDLVEVLLHGEGEAAAWLEGAGFTLEPGDGRVRAVRR